MDAKLKAWSRSSPAALLLRQDLYSGIINPKEDMPSKVQAKRPEFHDYGKTSFAQNFRKTCNDYLLVKDLDEETVNKWILDGSTTHARTRGK